MCNVLGHCDCSLCIDRDLEVLYLPAYVTLMTIHVSTTTTQYMISHTGQLGLLLSAAWEMSTGHSVR